MVVNGVLNEFVKMNLKNDFAATQDAYNPATSAAISGINYPLRIRRTKMKTLTQISLLLLALMVVSIGCDAAKEAANEAKDKAAGLADMANIDFGDFDMKGTQEKLTGITDGFKEVTADNVDGLTSKISGLTESMDGMGIDKLTGPAKTAFGGVISKFGDTIKAAMEGISDEGILGKLKPVVDALMEKIKAFA